MKLFRVILPVTDIEEASVFYAKVVGEKGKRVSPGWHYFNLEGTILVCDEPFADRDEGKED
jgi:extradiol dioxygenase family protein